MTEIYWAVVDRDWVGVPHAIAALALAAAAATLLLVSGSGPGGLVLAERVVAPSAGPAPRIEVREERAGTEFAVAGATFRVEPEPAVAWSRSLARSEPGPGRRWLVVAVEVGNRSRRGFDPALVAYLLRRRGDSLQAPDRSGIVGPASLGRTGSLAVGAAAQQRLAFRVPVTLRRPVLAIQAAPGRALEVRVPLPRG